LARAYSDLYQAAPHDVRVAARQRAGLRVGVEPAEESARISHQQMRIATLRAGSDAEALRAEAALADIDATHRENESVHGEDS